MSITERLANLSIPTVLVTVAVLLVIRYLLRKQTDPTLKSIAEIAESLAVALGLVFLLIRPFLVQAFFIPSASMHPTLLEDDHIIVNKLIYRVSQPKRGDVVVFLAPPEANSPGDTTEKDYIKRVIGLPGDVVRITPGYVLIGNIQYGHNELREALRGYSAVGGDGNVKLMGNQVLVDGKVVSKAEVAAALTGVPDGPVKVIAGKVNLNGKVLNEPFTAEDCKDPYPLPITDSKWIVTKGGEKYVKIPQGRLLVMGDNRNNSNDSRFWGLLDRKRMLGKAMFIFWPVNRIRWVR